MKGKCGTRQSPSKLKWRAGLHKCETEPTKECEPFCATWSATVEQELSSSWDGGPWPQQTWAAGGAAVSLSRGAGTPSKYNVAWAEVYFRRPTLLSYQVASSSIQPFGHNRHGPKNWVGLCSFFWGSWVPIKHIVVWAEAYLHTM